MSEGRRGFLERFVAPKKENKSTEENEQAPNPTLQSRRAFLKKVALAGAALAVEGLAKPVSAQENSDQKSLEEKTAERISRFEEKLSIWLGEIYDKYGHPDNRSLNEIEQVRNEFLQSDLYCELTDMASQFTNKEQFEDLWHIYDALIAVKCQGVLCKIWQDHQVYKANVSPGRNDFYATRVKDFLPTGKEVDDYEIDPRLGQILGLKLSPDAEKQVQRTIKEKPAWTRPENLKLFRLIVDNKYLRELASKSDMTLVEFYSLVKAISKLPSGVDAPEDPEELSEAEKIKMVEKHIRNTAEKMLEKRAAFCKKHILDGETDALIILNGYDAPLNGKTRFNSVAVGAVAEAAGVDKEKIKSISVGEKDDVLNKKIEWLEAIKNAPIKATVVINTHGSEKYLSVSNFNSDSKKNFFALDLAHVLARILRDSGNSRALGEKTFILNNCHSYDFANNVVERLKECFQVETDGGKTVAESTGLKWEEVVMPTFITMTQEGSLGFHEADLFSALLPYVTGVEKDGYLSGKRILQNAQPDVYSFNDLTVLQGEKGGLLEIGRNENQKNQLDA